MRLMGTHDETEHAFLAALELDPDDDARVVYTDWLEERADPRAEYLRMEAEFHALGHTANDLDARQLEVLGLKFEPGWRATVTRPRAWKKPEPKRVTGPAQAPPSATPASADIVRSPLAPTAPVPTRFEPPSPFRIWLARRFMRSTAVEPSTGTWKTVKTTAMTAFIVVGFVLLVMPKRWTLVGVLEAIVALFEGETMPGPIH